MLDMLKLDKTPLKKTSCIIQGITSGKTVELMIVCICIVHGECPLLVAFTGLSSKGCYKFPEESSMG